MHAKSLNMLVKKDNNNNIDTRVLSSRAVCEPLSRDTSFIKVTNQLNIKNYGCVHNSHKRDCPRAVNGLEKDINFNSRSSVRPVLERNSFKEKCFKSFVTNLSVE